MNFWKFISWSFWNMEKNIFMLYVCKLRRHRGQPPRAVACNLHFFPDELVNEKEKYKNIADEMDQAFSELSGF